MNKKLPKKWERTANSLINQYKGTSKRVELITEDGTFVLSEGIPTAAIILKSLTMMTKLRLWWRVEQMKQLSPKALEARRQYEREYRRKWRQKPENKEKQKEYERRYWESKAQQSKA